MAAAQPIIPIQIKVRPDTVMEINRLQEILHAENKTTAIKQAIEITNLLAGVIKNGGKIFLEEANGNRAKLVIPALEKCKQTLRVSELTDWFKKVPKLAKDDIENFEKDLIAIRTSFPKENNPWD